ncbi:DUF1345 domain-containing protein [Cellulomonas sp. zg-ZUI199]|uniref:DUF1345 domain-containing protein n=1 Tax=Cellulomonas wangleii TaxID=2816956 RepID=A0ABX8D2P7_9CELL|nr:DUF1345 domain-containing protein [Cellulomonas wangleii]MBO0923399.1 DUF1345 domain-containing protein [Cellulomonas wangleii]QVI61749.1 DUF1345 domain-containing protein [Cellulomonas wangleii]
MTEDIARGDVTPATRLAVSSAVGVVAAVVTVRAVPDATIVTALLVGWATVATVSSAWSWSFLWPLDADQTRTHATREEPTRLAAGAFLLTACVMSLVGIVVVLAGSQGRARDVGITAAMAAVIASWVALQTMFTVRYALDWYAEPVGGIDFHQDAPPRYSDFAYLAITVAMSFATSDPDIVDSGARRTVLAHALLSYVFGTFLVALLVNVLAGL